VIWRVVKTLVCSWFHFLSGEKPIVFSSKPVDLHVCPHTRTPPSRSKDACLAPRGLRYKWLSPFRPALNTPLRDLIDSIVRAHGLYLTSGPLHALYHFAPAHYFAAHALDVRAHTSPRSPRSSSESCGHLSESHIRRLHVVDLK
jgi:hypothetical protein